MEEGRGRADGTRRRRGVTESGRQSLWWAARVSKVQHGLAGFPDTSALTSRPSSTCNNPASAAHEGSGTRRSAE